MRAQGNPGLVTQFCCLGRAPRAQLLKKSAWLLHLVSDKAPPAAHDSNEVACAFNWCCYPHTGNEGLIQCLVRIAMQPEAMDVARSASQGLITMQSSITCPLNWEWKGRSSELMVLRVRPSPTFLIPQWTTVFRSDHMFVLVMIYFPEPVSP